MDIATASPAQSPTDRAEDFVPYRYVEGDPGCGLLLLCDHAENTLPAQYASLGLPAQEFSRHIAFDPGAAAVTLGLARRLGAPAVLSTFSRLLIDPNRGEDDPTLIMRLSDGAVVPGNRAVDEQERTRRLDRYYRPYHNAVTRAIDHGVATGRPPALVSIHSYTPIWRGHPRPWHAGILWDEDPRLAVPLIEAMRTIPDLIVGDNEPYTGALTNDTMNRHGTRRGLAHALIEVRQDLISDEEGAEIWADRLAPILTDLNRRDEIHDIRVPAGTN